MRYRANGKLMISGEYLVLAGAKALAIPVKYGQTLTFTKKRAAKSSINWTTLEKGNKWLQICFDGFDLTLNHDQELSAKKKNAAEFVRKLLLNAREMNPDFLHGTFSYDVTSGIEFDMSWGLGSSSSLIANVAQWAMVDPYQLLATVSKGSGYDIACALHNSPLLYRYHGPGSKPEVKPIQFNPRFAQQLFFIYSGNKQDSAAQIRNFTPASIPEQDVKHITLISDQMAQSANLKHFLKLMQTHEEIIARYTDMEPVQQRLFTDFPGAVKSLGAWGGDFLLAAADMPPMDIISYFRKKGHSVIFSFNDILL